jgi:uncharacterized phage protein (TIGR01671 family)
MNTRKFKFRVFCHAWKPPRVVELDEIRIFGEKNGKEVVEYLNQGLFTLLQFTGMVDRDGKEIFEGDILSRKDYLSFVVVFDDGRFLGKNKQSGAEFDLNKSFCKSFEVAGNIFENFELLGLTKRPESI